MGKIHFSIDEDAIKEVEVSEAEESLQGECDAYNLSPPPVSQGFGSPWPGKYRP